MAEISDDELKVEESASSGLTDIKQGSGEFVFEQALEAINALQQYASHHRSSKSVEETKEDLFSEDRFMYLDVVMKKYPRHLPPVTFIETVLPHPFHDPKTATSCIIVRDLDKYPLRLQDREKSARIYKQFLDETQHLTEFTQLLSLSQLMSEYRTYDDRRKLCHTYDVFIADKRLRGKITHSLGKEFVLNKKIPFVIDVTKNVRKNFRRVFKLTRTTLTPSTLKFKVKIGRLNQPADHLLANLRAVKKSLAKLMPGKWDNVRSAYVSVPACYELPIYVDWGSSNKVVFPKPSKRSAEFVEDELTTVDVKDEDAETPKVRVFTDGTVDFGKKGAKRQKREAVWTPPTKKQRPQGKRKLRMAMKRNHSKLEKSAKIEDTVKLETGASDKVKRRRLNASGSGE